MGYSRSKVTLEKIRPFLSDLEQGLSCSWEVPAGQEGQWAYKVREALYIARLYENDYPDLARVAERFKVRIVREGLVEAKPGGNTTQPKLIRGSTVTHGVDDETVSPLTGRSAATDGKQTADTIVQAWHDVQPSNSPLYFPEAELESEDLVKLYNWATKRNLIFFESFGAITLQPKTRDLEDLAWHPDDLLTVD